MAQLLDIENVIPLAGYLPLIAAAALAGIGLFVLSRNHKAAVNRLCSAGMLTLAGVDTAWFLFAQSSGTSFLLLWQRIILAANIVMLPVWYLFSLTFGSGGIWEGLRRQRRLAVEIGAVSLLFLCLVPTEYAIQDVLIRHDGSILFPLGGAGRAIVVVSLALAMIVLANLEMTVRYASRETRWKIKFLILGLFGILGFQIGWLSRTLLHSAIVPDSFGAQAIVHVTAGVLVTFSLVRHRLLDVDVFVSRHVLYRSLTFLLVGAYLLLPGIGRGIVNLFGFESGGWAWTALLVSGGLAVAALLLSESFQRRVRHFINTHFYRDKYDYRKEWLSLTDRLARAVTIDEVAPRIVEGLLETMWVGKAGIFLLDRDKTRLRLAFGRGFKPGAHVLHVDRAFLRHLSEYPELIDVEMPMALPIAGSCTNLVEELRSRGARIAAPMIFRDEVLGLLVVGSELSGRPFRPDDFDLCRTVAAQATTVIMNARMAEDLAHGNEIRAFAEMSAFVIHDIKNCANSLSLVAFNAEVYMHDPAFQQDAIRSIQKSVERMQKLLKCLSAVREPTLQKKHVDLNALVRNSLHALEPAVPGNVHLETMVGTMPRLSGDAEQLEGVIRNLTMNAIEAVEGEGTIRIQTFQDGDEAVLVMSDTGRGMSPQFISRSLFRPFQSTKGGLGIGLYQCKQVAEAHGGRIEIQSAEGQGTTCVLRLPVNGEKQLS